MNGVYLEFPRGGSAPQEPIGRNLDPAQLWKGELAWDPNRIFIVDAAQLKDSVRRPIALLMKAVERAAASDAIPIDIRRGDTLLIDNRRAFICRRELSPEIHWRLISPVSLHASIFRTPKRWLRLYYGFAETTR